tara:strand:- start:7 stop:489 length:483 start_codon:yes stop_codon:yes gene_type:complete
MGFFDWAKKTAQSVQGVGRKAAATLGDIGKKASNVIHSVAVPAQQVLSNVGAVAQIGTDLGVPLASTVASGVRIASSGVQAIDRLGQGDVMGARDAGAGLLSGTDTGRRALKVLDKASDLEKITRKTRQDVLGAESVGDVIKAVPQAVRTYRGVRQAVNA